MGFYDIRVRAIDGRDRALEVYRGRVLVIVNVASRCSFTAQYAGLEALYRKFADRGLTVLGFPCDQFGRQEPGNEAEIRSFCSLRYDVTFPMFAKVEVNGESAHPLYRHLKAARPGFLGTSNVKWNFAKFLVSRTGEVVGRYSSLTGPAQLEKAVVPLLDEKPTLSAVSGDGS